MEAYSIFAPHTAPLPSRPTMAREQIPIDPTLLAMSITYEEMEAKRQQVRWGATHLEVSIRLSVLSTH